jgi:hypothetical protein
MPDRARYATPAPQTKLELVIVVEVMVGSDPAPTLHTVKNVKCW